MRKTVPLILVAAGLIAAGCGGGDDTETSEPAAEETTVSSQEAVAQIAAVRRGLDATVVAYKQGDADQAADVASETYLQHFELVEGPLEEVDEELNEELEDQIRETLRDRIDEGASVAEVTALVDKIDRELDEAEQALGS